MTRAARAAARAAAAVAASLAACAVLAGLAAGTPWLLWHVTGWPLPRTLPTPATLRAGIAGQESARFLLDLVTCAGWAIWALFIAEVILEAGWWARQLPALARGPAGPHPAARLRERAATVSPPRALATVLVGGVLLGLIAATRGTGLQPVPRLPVTVQHAASAPAPQAGRPARPGTPAPTAPDAAVRILRLDATALAAQQPSAAEAYTLYTVQPGDNLWDIALAHLGDGEKWHQIYALNAGRPQADGERLVLPSLIQPGWILRIPAPAAPHGNGHLPAPRPRSARPAPRPGPTPPASPRPGGPHSPTPVTSPHASHAAGHGIAIPWGGLAGAGLAAAVAAALARASIQRRRRYQPPRIMTSALGPPPEPAPVIGVLRRAVRPPAGAGSGAGGDGSTPVGPFPAPAAREPGPAAAAGVYPPRAQPPGVLALGLRGDREAVIDVAALGGLGLTGPGAMAAARSVLLTLLTQAEPDTAAVPAEVLVPAADAATLIPGYRRGEVTAGSRAGLTVTDTLETALDQLEAAMLSRARIAASAGESAEPAASRTGIAALIATPGPGTAERLAAILQFGRRAGLAAVLLGAWPHGVTCHVAEAGTVTATVPPAPALDGIRLFHLAAADTEAILSVLDAAGDTPRAAAEPARADSSEPPDTAPAADVVPGALPGGEEPPAAQAAGSQPARSAVPDGDDNPAAPGPQARPGPDPDASHDGPPAPAAREAAKGRIVQVSLLGPPRITAGGQEISGGLRKARELLAFLALHPDGATGDAISEALWPESPPGHGTTQRNIALRKLRELLRAATGLAGPMFVTLAADRYRLDPALFDIDVWRFQQALDRARHAGDGPARLAACQDAASVYRGPLADGAGYDWAEPYAEAARRRALDAWTQIAEILAPRDPGQALAALEAAAGHDPYNEFVYQKIMRLQAAAGRLDAVRRTLSLLESRLRDLGVTPGPQTRTLAASLLGLAPPRNDPRESRRAAGPPGHDRQLSR